MSPPAAPTGPTGPVQPPGHRVQGTAIRSQAWLGFGGQDGSETSGVSPNNNPRRERPASSGAASSSRGLNRPARGAGRLAEEDEIVQASWKREGP